MASWRTVRKDGTWELMSMKIIVRAVLGVALLATVPAAADVPSTVRREAPYFIEVMGFRSAHFGMNEAEVRAAIQRDFDTKLEAIRSEDNNAERTCALGVQVPDVMPGGGTSSISYVFGYKTKALIQVGLLWSKATDDKITPEKLISNGNLLFAHLIGAGYKPDTIATNVPIPGGVLMFRANDMQNHTTMLIMQGSSFSEDNDTQKVFTPSALLLLYIANAKDPDVYRLPPGSF